MCFLTAQRAYLHFQRVGTSGSTCRMSLRLCDSNSVCISNIHRARNENKRDTKQVAHSAANFRHGSSLELRRATTGHEVSTLVCFSILHVLSDSANRLLLQLRVGQIWDSLTLSETENKRKAVESTSTLAVHSEGGLDFILGRGPRKYTTAQLSAQKVQLLLFCVLFPPRGCT